MLEWVESDGVKLAVEVIGEGEPVSVVSHGLTGSRNQVSLFAPFLPGTKVLFDFRGHGESDRPPPGSYTMDHFAADVDAVATAYGATCAMGASLGGGATLRLLVRDPDRFQRLVFFLPARLEEDADSAEARRRLLWIAEILESHPIEEAADRIVALEEAEGAFHGFASSRDVRRRAILEMNGDGVPWAIRGCIDDPPLRAWEPIRRVTAPALVVGQAGDEVHRPEVARELAEELPDAELIIFESPLALIEGIPGLVQRTAAFLLPAAA